MEDWKAAFKTDTRTSGRLRPFDVERTLPQISSTPGNCEHQQLDGYIAEGDNAVAATK